MEVGESLRQHAQDAIQTVVKRYMPDGVDSHVTMSKENHHFRCDLSVHLSHDFIVRTHDNDNDAYKAVDKSLEKLELRIRRYKNRLRDRKRQKDIPNNINATYFVVNTQEEDTSDDTPVIIAEMNKSIPRVTVGEAVMQLDLSEDPALLFTNAASDQLNMVYRRADGNIGWVNPK